MTVGILLRVSSWERSCKGGHQRGDSFAGAESALQARPSWKLFGGRVCRFALARAKVDPAWWFVWESACKSGNLQTRSFAGARPSVQEWQPGD